MSKSVRFSLAWFVAFAVTNSIAAEPKRLVEDFDAKLALDWTFIRHEPDFLSLERRPGELIITTLPGTIYSNLERDLFEITRNIALLNQPIATKDNFVATLNVTQFAPVFEDQEVALVLYQSDNSYFKLCAKCGDDDATTRLRAVAEYKGGCTPWFDRKQSFDGPFWLRLSRKNGKYAIFFSDDGEEFKKLRGVGFDPVDPKKPTRIGFYATNGSESVPPTSKPIDVVIESFELVLP